MISDLLRSDLGDDLLVSNLDDSQEILENAGSDSEEGGDCDQNIAEDLLDVAAGSPEKSYLEALRADILEAEAASPGSTRAVNLLGAFFGEDKALGIFDFARLVRMTIHILDRSWTEDDLLLTSEVSLQQYIPSRYLTTLYSSARSCGVTILARTMERKKNLH